MPDGVVAPLPSQYTPGLHSPLHSAVGIAGAAPYCPARQTAHTADPARLYRPAGHVVAVLEFEPAGQVYPAVQLPLQLGDGIAVVLPNVPAGPGVQLSEPNVVYVPAGQGDAVAFVVPAGHRYPATHGPVHVDVVRPVVEP